MGKQIEIGLPKRGFPWPVIGAVNRGGARCGMVHARREYKATTWERAMVHVEAILLRGNQARAKNIAGEFLITEMVTQ